MMQMLKQRPNKHQQTFSNWWNDYRNIIGTLGMLSDFKCLPRWWDLLPNGFRQWTSAEVCTLLTATLSLCNLATQLTPGRPREGWLRVAVCLRPKKSTHKNGEKLQWSYSNAYIIPFFEVLGGSRFVLDCLFVFACMNTRAIGQLSFSLVQEVHQPARMFFEPKK